MGTISEEMYCSEQINVPLNLPYILKQYAKAAIKTQPRDLLHWSSAYFRALANGDVPPVKDRIEYPLISTPSGLTAGFLRILIKQFGKGGIIEEKDLINKWKGVGLELDELQNMLRLCGFRKTVRWLNFVAVAAGFLSPNLTQTMILICELLTDEPEGGSAAIVYQTFMTLYIYLARMDCGPICHLKSNMADTFSEEVSAEAEEGTSEKSSERLSEIEVALERKPTLDSNDSANGVIMVWEDVTHPDFVQERNSIKDPKTAEENVEDNVADMADIIPVGVVDEATTVVDEEEKADEQETVKSVESYDNTGITLTFHDEEQDVKIDDYTGPIEPKLKKRFEKKLEEEQEGGANEKTDEDKTIMNDEMKENDETKENDDKEEGGGEEEGDHVGEKKNEDEQGVGGGDEKEENKSDSKAKDEVEHKEEGDENENGEKVEGEDEIEGKEGDEEGKGDMGEGEEGAEKGTGEKETEEEVEKEIAEEVVKKETEEEGERGIEEEVKKETEGEKEIEEVNKETEGEVKKEIEEEVKKETDKKEEKGEGEKTPKSRTKKRKKKQAKKEGEEGEEEESDHEEQSRYEYSLELEEEEDEKLEEEKSVKEETVVITEEVEEVKEEEEELKEEEEVAEEQVKEEQSIDLEMTDSAVHLQGQRKSDIQVYGCLHLPKHRRRSVTDSIVSEPDNHFWVHIPGIGPMVPEKQILSLKAYFSYCSEKQGGYIMPRNIKHHLCPSLEPPVEMEKRRSSEVEWINDAVHHDK